MASVPANVLSRPLRDLAAAAARLGDGDFDVGVPDTGIAEAAAIAEALRSSAERLSDALRRQRQFASNASHQLRTPLTALRLRLEDVALWPEVPEPIREELGAAVVEVERMSETVSGLLALSRAGAYSAAERVPARSLARAARERWADIASPSGRAVTEGRVDAVDVVVPVDAVRQVLDVLVENALRHGRGDVTLEVLAEADTFRLRVRDEGPGLRDAGRQRIFERDVRLGSSAGEGIGLSLARELAVSMGGRLEVAPVAPTTFDLVLPRPAA